jgi:hypothetical protein
MVEIERRPGQSVQIGRYTLQVLAVRAGEVVFALLDPDNDCAGCGASPADRHGCPGCREEVRLCSACVGSWRCARCAGGAG